MNGLSLSLYAIIRDNENAVGYNSSQLGNQNNFKTVVFNTVGYNTADVQDIKLVGSQGYGTEFFNVWEGLPTAVEGVDFMWVGTAWDEQTGLATDGYWMDMSTYGEAIFSVPQGQAVVINATEGIGIRNAGQVPTEKVTFTAVGGNNFTGNPFPAVIDVQNIKLVGSTGYGTEFFNVWEGLPTAVEGVDFMWVGTAWDEQTGLATDGYWMDMGTYGEAVYTIQPNQGVVINAAAGMTIEIEPPYSL